MRRNALDLTNPSSVVQCKNLRSPPPIREAESAIGVLRNALGKCKSKADRSESAIGVLRNALGMCKSEADRSESAIGVLKTSPKTLAGSPRPPRDIALRSPPIREAESAIGVLRNALGRRKSEAERSESATGVLRNALGMCKSEQTRAKVR